MEVFRKRETVLQNIAYMAIMAAINIIFVIMSNLLPVLLFALVLILPLTRTIVTIYCKKKYYPIYAVTTLGLCIAVAGGFSIFDALIYVFPSIIVGFLFGICVEKNIPAILILTGATIVQFGLSFLTFYILNKMVLGFDIMQNLFILFGLQNFPYLDVLLRLFVYLIAQVQMFFSFLFVKLEIRKLGIFVNLECNKRYWMYLITFTTFFLSVLSYFFFQNWTLVFIIMPLAIYVYETIQLLLKKKIALYILIGLIHILFIFLFAFLYQYTSAPTQLIIIVTLTGSMTIIDLMNNYCFVKNTK